MKEKYNYDNISGDYNGYGCLASMAVILLGGAHILRKPDDNNILLYIAGALFLVLFVFYKGYPFGYCFFEAGESSVTFTRLFKKQTIGYSSIKSIDIDTELRKMWFRGKEYRHYAERIIFHCDDGEHIFALKHSSENEPVLTNSQFTRLKEFIEENMA